MEKATLVAYRRRRRRSQIIHDESRTTTTTTTNESFLNTNQINENELIHLGSNFVIKMRCHVVQKPKWW